MNPRRVRTDLDAGDAKEKGELSLALLVPP
jgi:hypothetical protein